MYARVDPAGSATCRTAGSLIQPVPRPSGRYAHHPSSCQALSFDPGPFTPAVPAPGWRLVTGWGRSLFPRDARSSGCTALCSCHTTPLGMFCPCIYRVLLGEYGCQNLEQPGHPNARVLLLTRSAQPITSPAPGRFTKQ